jgi:hypothetical protein
MATKEKVVVLKLDETTHKRLIQFIEGVEVYTRDIKAFPNASEKDNVILNLRNSAEYFLNTPSLYGHSS